MGSTEYDDGVGGVVGQTEDDGGAGALTGVVRARFRAGWLAPALMTAFGLLGNRAYYRRTQAMADGLAEEPPERLEQTCLKRGGVTPLLPALLAAALLLLGVWWQVFLQRAALLLYPRG